MALSADDIEQQLGYRFADRTFLSQALTHASFVANQGVSGNDRLEFLGDAVIDLAIARLLFERYPEKDEGWLTQTRARLVDEEALATKARAIDLGRHLILGKGEQTGGGSTKASILSGAYEAVMGAVFLDGGYDACERIIREQFIEIVYLDDTIDPKNFKSLLQERMQKDGKGLPRYEVIDITGPDHDRSYRVAVYVGDQEWGRGTGTSKKEAEMEAAREALSR
jgi:ribonuclease-3